MAPRIPDISGQRFGMLTAVRYSHSQDGSFWICHCDCGRSSTVRANQLRYGTRSCGCLSLAAARRNAEAGRERRRSPYPHSRALKEVRRNMICRCHVRGTRRWDCYGGRGIKVCAEWRADPRAFYRWATEAGYRPGLQIDRIDNDGDYGPRNCRWVTPLQQANNTRRNHIIEWRGERKSMADWQRELNFPPGLLSKRLLRDWPIDRAMTIPPRRWPSQCSR